MGGEGLFQNFLILIIVGLSLKCEVVFDDYLVFDWELIVILCGFVLIDLIVVVFGIVYVFVEIVVIIGIWKSGFYVVLLWVIFGDDVYEVEVGQVIIVVDLVVIEEDYDLCGYVQRMFVVIEVVIEGCVIRDQQSYMINGCILVCIFIVDFLMLCDCYKKEVVEFNFGGWYKKLVC